MRTVLDANFTAAFATPAVHPDPAVGDAVDTDDPAHRCQVLASFCQLHLPHSATATVHGLHTPTAALVSVL